MPAIGKHMPPPNGSITRTPTCPVCSVTFTTHSNRATYCSTACRAHAAKARREGLPIQRGEKHCITCDGALESRHHNYCSTACKPLRIRDGKVYAHPSTQAKTCPVCGSTFTTRKVKVYCSDWCAQRCLTAERYRERIGRQCEYCGEGLPITHKLGRRYCSESCQVRSNQDARRARKRGLPSEDFSRQDVYERDGWVCQLCGDPIDPSLRGRDPMSASLDHVIPLAWPESPGHVMSNAQASHLRCNMSKGSRHA